MDQIGSIFRFKFVKLFKGRGFDLISLAKVNYTLFGCDLTKFLMLRWVLELNVMLTKRPMPEKSQIDVVYVCAVEMGPR